MKASIGMAGSCASSSPSIRRTGSNRVLCASSHSASLTDQFRTLKVQPGASLKEVKKAFRQLALQYHPDVCKGSNCGVQFSTINEAYDVITSSLRQSEEYQYQLKAEEDGDVYGEEQMRGMHDSSWDLWEEWMGWEGAGIRDYSSPINPYT